MLHKSKYSNKILIGFMSLGFAGSLAIAPASKAQESVPPSQRPGNTPVTNTQPGGAERDSNSRTPAASDATQTIQETTETGQTGDTSSQSFEQALSENGDFSTLLAAIKAAGLESTLAGSGPFTLFAPTNEAFAAIPPETLRQLLLPENRPVLRQILTYHVVQGNIPSSAIKPGSVNTVEGSPVAIATDAGAVTVAGASVTQPDITTSNGVIHAIDEVLLPPSLLR